MLITEEESSYLLSRFQRLNGWRLVINLILIRNPKCFQAGNLHKFLDEWRTIEPSDEVLD